jgi:hypothetical protein
LAIDPVPRIPFGIERAPCATALYLIDVHQDLESRLKWAPLFDVVLVAQPDDLQRFLLEGGVAAEWLPLGADPAIHAPPSPGRDLQVGFVGKLGAPGSKRREALQPVLEAFSGNDVAAFYSPVEMARIYARSKVVINASINGDMNMRVFEAMASGALLVTDRIANGMDRLFIEGQHYVGYSSPNEAVEVVRHYLADEARRFRIAAEGQALVLSAHTYRHRLQVVLEQSASQRGCALARRLGSAQVASRYAALAAVVSPADGLRVAFRYGPSGQGLVALARTILRRVNRHVPMTLGARRAAALKRAGDRTMPHRPLSVSRDHERS